MTKDEVRKLLGEPGKIQTFGTAGAFWYYPDFGGGRVKFGGQGTVESWSKP
jgi:hypothetical protein